MAREFTLLIVGGGGREHALAWKLAQSPRRPRIVAAPGNPGIETLGECVAVAATDVVGLVRLARDLRPDLVVVGPEAPLAAGLADRIRAGGTPVFGPSAAAARIEASKEFARELMTRACVAQPRYRRFTDFAECEAYLESEEARRMPGVVVKADGLAAGKGAVVCPDLVTARETARAMLVAGEFGPAGKVILVEERLEGEEASLLVVTDGEEAVPLLPAQDYKRAGDGDTGPNTGGMGAYSPAPVLSPQLVEEAIATIVRPVLGALADLGTPFRGCLYAGLMSTTDGLKVIEFNCRFGDPEAQAILPLMESDLLEICRAAAVGELGEVGEIAWKAGAAVTVVMAGQGYPGPTVVGLPISGLDGPFPDGASVFHAGTRRHGRELLTAGGRVLAVTGTGPDFPAARKNAYEAVSRIRFEGATYRKDVALRVCAPPVGATA